MLSSFIQVFIVLGMYKFACFVKISFIEKLVEVFFCFDMEKVCDQFCAFFQIQGSTMIFVGLSKKLF